MIKPRGADAVVPDAVHAFARGLAASFDESEREKLAWSFGVRLVAAWWRTLTSEEDGPHPLRPPFAEIASAEVPLTLAATADRLGAALRPLDLEAAILRIGRAYSALLPEARRSTLGIYYTPPALAGRLLDQATAAGVDWTRARVFDPACGGGAFLVPAARRMRDALHGQGADAIVAALAERLCGQDVDPFGAWLSQIAFDALLLPLTRGTGLRLPKIVTVGDSLRGPEPCPAFDLVVGNPPYRRVRLAPSERARFERSLHGHANLYGLFIEIALRHLKSGGVLAYVTPTSFLAGRYFKRLRALLGSEAPPVSMDFIAPRSGVFEKVLQETLLAVYRRGAEAGPIAAHEAIPESETRVRLIPAGKMRLPPDPSRPWLLPRTPAQAPLVARLSRFSSRLADWGYAVKTGPLVWNRYKTRLALSPGAGRRPLVWAESVGSDGRFRWRAERRNGALWFETRPGEDWLLTRTPCVLLQRTTAKEQSRRLIAAPLPSAFLAHYGAVVVENHLNMVRPTSETPPVRIEIVSAFLNSAAADRAFRCVSGSVAVSAYELAALPLPPVERLDELANLVDQGAGPDLVEQACARLYL